MKLGDISLLKDPVAQELLQSAIPARLAYVWLDGTPRVIPVWFLWSGEEFVVFSPPASPKIKALGMEAKVSLTIDTDTWPSKGLTVRGTAITRIVDAGSDEHLAQMVKYVGEAAPTMFQMFNSLFPRWARITIRPEWVSIFDATENELPTAVMDAIAAMTPSS